MFVVKKLTGVIVILFLKIYAEKEFTVVNILYLSRVTVFVFWFNIQEHNTYKKRTFISSNEA